MLKVPYQRAFQELTDEELDAVIAKTQRLSFAAEERLMREGEDQQRIFVILEGEVRVIRYARDGRETHLSDPLGPGDTMGEMSFVDHLGASATLIASSPVVVDSLDREAVDALAATYPQFLQRLYHSLLFTVIRRLRVLDHKISFPA